MSTITIKYAKQGQKELIKALEAAKDWPKRRGKVERAALAGARVWSYDMESRAPKDTGRAAKTIRARLVSSRPGEAVTSAGPSSRGYYLVFQEFGTSFHPPQPFMRPVFDEKQREATQAMADEYKRIQELAIQRRSSR